VDLGGEHGQAQGGAKEAEFLQGLVGNDQVRGPGASQRGGRRQSGKKKVKEHEPIHVNGC
jgi:hypothetical protein